MFFFLIFFKFYCTVGVSAGEWCGTHLIAVAAENRSTEKEGWRFCSAKSSEIGAQTAVFILRTEVTEYIFAK